MNDKFFDHYGGEATYFLKRICICTVIEAKASGCYNESIDLPRDEWKRMHKQI